MKPIRSPVNMLSLSLLGLVLTLGGGCVSTPASNGSTLRLDMSAHGQVLFEGDSFEPGALPGALKSRGIPFDTSITVAIPATTPMTLVRDLSRRLAAVGYRRVLFSRPKHAEAAPVTKSTTSGRAYR